MTIARGKEYSGEDNLAKTGILPAPNNIRRQFETSVEIEQKSEAGDLQSPRPQTKRVLEDIDDEISRMKLPFIKSAIPGVLKLDFLPETKRSLSFSKTSTTPKPF